MSLTRKQISTSAQRQKSQFLGVASRFNLLPSIESAHLRLKSGDTFQTAISALAPIFVKNGVHDHWGICLLHKHWSLCAGEVPVHVRARTSTGVEWICEPRKRTFNKTSWPSVLSAAMRPYESLKPLEFSTDSSVRSENRVLGGRPEFQSQFCAAMRAHGLAKTFGLVAVREPTEHGRRLVEFNYEGRVSMVRETAAADFDAGSLIQTCWRFNPVATTRDCIVSCFTDCQDLGAGHKTYHVHNHYVHNHWSQSK